MNRRSVRFMGTPGTEVRGQRSEIRSKRSEVRGQSQRSEVRGQRAEVRVKRSEVEGKNQKSEVRGQRSEVRGQKSEVEVEVGKPKSIYGCDKDTSSADAFNSMIRSYASPGVKTRDLRRPYSI